MTDADFPGTVELYRLRRSVRRRGGGGQQLEPVPGHHDLHPTWRDAQAAARTAGGRRRGIVVQSVLVDATGAVVFPDERCQPRSSGAWKTRRWAGRSLHAGSGKRRRGQAGGKAAPGSAKTSPDAPRGARDRCPRRG